MDDVIALLVDLTVSDSYLKPTQMRTSALTQTLWRLWRDRGAGSVEETLPWPQKMASPPERQEPVRRLASGWLHLATIRPSWPRTVGGDGVCAAAARHYENPS